MAIYRDELSKRAIQRRASLAQRDEFLLRATTRTASGGQVIVAALPVLAWTPTDLISVLVRLAGRHETLRSIAEDVTIDPATPNLEELKRIFNSAARRFSAKGVPGGKASGIKRAADADAKIERIKPFWGLAEPTTAALCKEHGISRPTIEARLGPRRAAQREYADDIRRRMLALKVAESNRKRRKNDVED